jgi:hypothetical protein
MSDKKISQLTAAAPLTGTEQLPLVQGGVTLKASTQNVANLAIPTQTGQNGKYLTTNGSVASWDAINISTADVTGTLPIANGGTGQTSASSAINALLPSQTGENGKYLTTNGTTASWANVSAGYPTIAFAVTLTSGLVGTTQLINTTGATISITSSTNIITVTSSSNIFTLNKTFCTSNAIRSTNAFTFGILTPIFQRSNDSSCTFDVFTNDGSAANISQITAPAVWQFEIVIYP